MSLALQVPSTSRRGSPVSRALVVSSALVLASCATSVWFGAPSRVFGQEPTNVAATAPDAAATVVAGGVKYLLAAQHADGSWSEKDGDSQAPGKTALVQLALLRGGVEPNHESLARCRKYLGEHPPALSYGIALELLAALATPSERRELIKSRIKWLVDAQAVEGEGSGGWSYAAQRTTRGDGSCTRFAIWALDAARRAGFADEIPETTWRRAAEYWLRSQQAAGTWGYVPSATNGTPTMTLAGIAALESVRGAVDDRPLHDRLDVAIDKAWVALDRTYDPPTNLDRGTSFPFYWVHSLTIAERMSQREKLNGRSPSGEVRRLLDAHPRTERGAWKATMSESELVATALAILALRATEAK